MKGMGRVGGVESVSEEDGVEGEEVFMGNLIEQVAGDGEVADTRVEGEEGGGEEVGGGDGEEEEAGVELAAEVEKAVVVGGAVADDVAEEAEVRGVVGGLGDG